MDGWMEGWADGWVDGLVDGWVDGLVDGWMDGWVDGWVDGWLGGWMGGDGWMGGWMGGWMDRWMGGCRKELQGVPQVVPQGGAARVPDGAATGAARWCCKGHALILALLKAAQHHPRKKLQGPESVRFGARHIRFPALGGA